MDKRYLFERNLLALCQKDPLLCSRLSAAETTLGRYRFLEARSGGVVPALADTAGGARPLHSMIDPEREGRRLAASLGEEGFLVFLGFGGGYHIQGALERARTEAALAVEYDINGMAELLCVRDYAALFNDPRFRLLVDPSPREIEAAVLALYQPALAGGLRAFPLRGRTERDSARFAEAGGAIQSALDKVSGDFSVQARFGRRWFANILRNVLAAEGPQPPLLPKPRAAVVAAGPSLDGQLPLIKAKRDRFFLIAADTSLPVLLNAGIVPDAAAAIDCQHISYLHFMRGLPPSTLLFLDLAGPCLAASRSPSPYFFSGGHPLTRFISRTWRSFPELDTSGGNVTYTAVSLAEALGARRVELFGADFSYPRGRTYARGTYLGPYFAARQRRTSPLEAQESAFLYRAPLEKKTGPGGWYYETPLLRFYRERLEEKSFPGEIAPVPGLGAPLRRPQEAPRREARSLRLFAAGRPQMSARDFLTLYAARIRALPRNHRETSPEDYPVLTTLLPLAAALRQKIPAADAPDLLSFVKAQALGEIAKVMGEGKGAGSGEWGAGNRERGAGSG